MPVPSMSLQESTKQCQIGHNTTKAEHSTRVDLLSKSPPLLLPTGQQRFDIASVLPQTMDHS
jgi:hypothetical protein